jgi:hypothetical protein
MKKKTMIYLIAAGMLTLNAVAKGDDPKKKKDTDTYCAKMKDGKLTVMHEGSPLTSNATLPNGTQIKTDGTVIRKNGSKTMMKEGDCLDKDGKVNGQKNQPDNKNRGKGKNDMDTTNNYNNNNNGKDYNENDSDSMKTPKKKK